MLRWLSLLKAWRVWCLVVLPVVAAAATPADFKRASNLFEYGDYAKAIPLLEELVLPGRLEDDKQVAAAHRMLGVSYYQVGRRQEAAREFKSLLYIDPDAKLDPFLTPPAVVDFFDSVKAEMADRLPGLRELREKEKQERARVEAGKPRIVEGDRQVNRVVTRKVRVTPVLLFFVPFGVPQFLMGHWIRGSIVLGLQVLSLFPSVLVFAVEQAILGPRWPPWTPPVIDPAAHPWKEPLLSALLIVRWSTLALIPLAYVLGVVDAFVLPNTEVVESETAKEVAVPVPKRPATTPPARAQPRPATPAAPAPEPPGDGTSIRRPPAVSPADATPPRLEPSDEPAPDEPPPPAP